MTKMDYHNNNSNVSECCEGEMTAAECVCRQAGWWSECVIKSRKFYSVEIDKGLQLFGNFKRKVRMIQCVSNSDSLCWVKGK